MTSEYLDRVVFAPLRNWERTSDAGLPLTLCAMIYFSGASTSSSFTIIMMLWRKSKSKEVPQVRRTEYYGDGVPPTLIQKGTRYVPPQQRFAVVAVSPGSSWFVPGYWSNPCLAICGPFSGGRAANPKDSPGDLWDITSDLQPQSFLFACLVSRSTVLSFVVRPDRVHSFRETTIYSLSLRRARFPLNRELPAFGRALARPILSSPTVSSTQKQPSFTMRASTLVAAVMAAAPSLVAAGGSLGWALGAKLADGSCKYQADYEADFKALFAASGSKVVRIYAADQCNTAQQILPAAKAQGFKVILGVW